MARWHFWILSLPDYKHDAIFIEQIYFFLKGYLLNPKSSNSYFLFKISDFFFIFRKQFPKVQHVCFITIFLLLWQNIVTTSNLWKSLFWLMVPQVYHGGGTWEQVAGTVVRSRKHLKTKAQTGHNTRL